MVSTELRSDAFEFVTTNPSAAASATAGTAASSASASSKPVTPINDQGPGLIRIDDDNALLSYAGSWTPIASTGSTGGSVHFAQAVGASVSLRNLAGVSQISWFTSVSPGAATADITIDDQVRASEAWIADIAGSSHGQLCVVTSGQS